MTFRAGQKVSPDDFKGAAKVGQGQQWQIQDTFIVAVGLSEFAVPELGFTADFAPDHLYEFKWVILAAESNGGQYVLKLTEDGATVVAPPVILTVAGATSYSVLNVWSLFRRFNAATTKTYAATVQQLVDHNAVVSAPSGGIFALLDHGIQPGVVLAS